MQYTHYITECTCSKQQKYIYICIYTQIRIIFPLISPSFPLTYPYLVLPLELGPHAPEVLALALGRTDVVL